MSSKNSAYKRKLDVADRLLRKEGVDSDKRDLVYSIMGGTYRNGSGKGSKTYEGQRVDTYEGRISAVKDILGLEGASQFGLLEKVVKSNDYLNKTVSKTEGISRGEVVSNYIGGLYEEPSTKPTLKLVRKSAFRKAILGTAAGLTLFAQVAAAPVTNKGLEKKVVENEDKAVLITGKEYTPKNDGSIEVTVVNRKNSSLPTNAGAQAGPTNVTERMPVIQTNTLEKVTVTNNVAPSKLLQPSYIENKEENVTPIKVSQDNFRNFQTVDLDDDGKIDDVTSSPRYFGKALKNHFVAWGESLKDTKEMGYDSGKQKGRLRSLGRSLLSPVDSVMGIVSGGRWGLHEDTREARSENNVLLGSIGSLYDGVQSIGKGVVDTPDLVLGGLTEKVLSDGVGGAFRTTINSTVDTGNFILSVPADGLQWAENKAFDNNGLGSVASYEVASTIMRFAGNVVLHEAPFDGRYVEVRDPQGKVHLIQKTELRATLESLGAVLLDGGLLFSDKGDHGDNEGITGDGGNGNSVGVGGGGGSGINTGN